MRTYSVMLFTKDLETGAPRNSIDVSVDIDGNVHEIFIDGKEHPATRDRIALIEAIYGRDYLKKRALQKVAREESA